MNTLMQRFLRTLKDPSGVETISRGDTELVKMHQFIEGTNTIVNVVYFFDEAHVKVAFGMQNVLFRNVNYEVLKTINQFNINIRPFKFSVNDNNALLMEYDVLDADNKIDELLLYAVLGIDILEKLHPEIMRLMWL